MLSGCLSSNFLQNIGSRPPASHLVCLLILRGNESFAFRLKATTPGLLCPRWHTERAKSANAGVAWTEEEHRLFLLGLQKLGKVIHHSLWRVLQRNWRHCSRLAAFSQPCERCAEASLRRRGTGAAFPGTMCKLGRPLKSPATRKSTSYASQWPENANGGHRCSTSCRRTPG